VGEENRRLYVCPQCGGTQVITVWKAADVAGEPEVATSELCPVCDGSGQVLGPNI
jgi:RNA polymerase subunit RPABC4/transcription elongation factor Spt4